MHLCEGKDASINLSFSSGKGSNDTVIARAFVLVCHVFSGLLDIECQCEAAFVMEHHFFTFAVVLTGLQNKSC